jgi:hypothetical protein
MFGKAAVHIGDFNSPTFHLASESDVILIHKVNGSNSLPDDEIEAIWSVSDDDGRINLKDKLLPRTNFFAGETRLSLIMSHIYLRELAIFHPLQWK